MTYLLLAFAAAIALFGVSKISRAAQCVKELQVPALNFAAVVIDDPNTGMHRTLHHIRLREPAAEPFEPPQAARPKPHGERSPDDPAA